MIDLTKASTVYIGRRGENHFRSIEFDISSLMGNDYPATSLQAIYKRPDGTAYPVVTSYSAGVLTWSPSAADTIDAGVGQLEIRVVFGNVFGKSAKVITIVEEALADGIAEPPEPPAQEWLNQVLAALAALDVNDVYSLLTLTYNSVNDNHSLLNTTHDLIGETRDTLYTRTGILLNHFHPIETATAPDLLSRRASITFTNIVTGSNVVLGSITYTIVASLGSPAVNNVQVRMQSNLRQTVQKLAEAIRGIQDNVNIAYGTGTNPNPVATAYWTSRIFSIGDISIATGESQCCYRVFCFFQKK